jgi:protein-tyrosine phosphatase
MKKVKVLFVCLGNICRSPLAEAIFKHKISERGLSHLIEADSCGTANYHVGHSPDPRTIANALKNGISIDHSGQQLCVRHIEEYDFIIAMDKSNHQNILKLDTNGVHSKKISLMRSYDLECDDESVPDPYYGGERDFQRVFEIVDRSVDSFISFMEKEHLKLQ